MTLVGPFRLNLFHDSVIPRHTKSSELERMSTGVIWGPSFMIHIQKFDPQLREMDRLSLILSRKGRE